MKDNLSPKKAYFAYSYSFPIKGRRYILTRVKIENYTFLATRVNTSVIQNIIQLSTSIAIVITENSYYILRLQYKEKEEFEKIIFGYSDIIPKIGEKLVYTPISLTKGFGDNKILSTQTVIDSFNTANIYMCKTLTCKYIIYTPI